MHGMMQKKNASLVSHCRICTLHQVYERLLPNWVFEDLSSAFRRRFFGGRPGESQALCGRGANCSPSAAGNLIPFKSAACAWGLPADFSRGDAGAGNVSAESCPRAGRAAAEDYASVSSPSPSRCFREVSRSSSISSQLSRATLPMAGSYMMPRFLRISSRHCLNERDSR